jgi:hypothetical protein
MVSYLVIPCKPIFEGPKMKDSLLGKAAMLYVKFQIWVFVLIMVMVVINTWLEAQ